MVYCSALNCQNATSGVYKNSTVTFYGFPLQNKPLLKQWIHNMGRDMGTPSKHQRLCSKHFEDTSFEIDPLKIRKNRRLLKEAVPKKFILGEDGNWLVGTPRSFCGGISNKTRKRIRNPEHLKVPGTFDTVAAHEGKNLEDWPTELYKKVIKENYESLTSLGKGSGETVIKSEMQSHAQSSENTELHGSFSGGSQDLTCQISDKEVTFESCQNSEADQAMGRRTGEESHLVCLPGALHVVGATEMRINNKLHKLRSDFRSSPMLPGSADELQFDHHDLQFKMGRAPQTLELCSTFKWLDGRRMTQTLTKI
ncbi:peroxynitrite isomerase THAP4-like isoform X5 [Struthio camelus]|uniref:peroxynitrite isomerase THAP4-like isoform X5 n=1 Tax=Struthio camelus TaxID=8801 RepID=UPI003603E286